MIASLRGNLIFKDSASVVVECGGVGMKCLVTTNTLNNLPQTGDEVFFFTYMAVREDAIDLFGFLSAEELNAFKLIISVNGVGPKIGLALLSEFSAERLLFFISTNDAKSLTSASGVGIKLAQRIILELKDKVGSVTTDDSAFTSPTSHRIDNTASSEAVAALISLGYSKGEASLAVGRIEGDLTAEELIKQALKSLTRGL